MTIERTIRGLALCAALVLAHVALAQTQIEFNNTSGACPRGAAVACTAPDNRVSLSVTTQDPNPPKEGSAVIPRFKAFWIPGDGNYWEFPNTADDSESRTPPIPYNYSRPGEYNVTVYLTGKYTNHHPPPGAERRINVGNMPVSPPAENLPTPFFERPGAGEYDFFPVHEIRKNYLIPFVLSYPATIDSSWGYLFFNGRTRGGGAWAEKPLKYQKTTGEVARYYNGNAAGIVAHPASNLGVPEAVDGLNFVPGFASLQSRYADFVYFPLETARAGDLPTGFTKKRYFPLFWADSSSAIVLGKQDSMMAFYYIVTAPRPLPKEQHEALNAALEKFDLNLSADQPINFNDEFADRPSRTNLSARGVQQSGPPSPLQYIQGVYENDVRYVAAHDPNELRVTKIEALPDGRYRVSFHLEMCNKGRGDTHSQTVDLFDRFGLFSDFVYAGNPVPQTTQANHYEMKSKLFIAGIPDKEYEMMCDGFDFSATTDCAGIRALWEGNASGAFRVCVRFDETFAVECGDNLPIDSCEFKIDNRCPCAKNQSTPTCGGEDSILIFVLLLVLILLLWKLVAGNSQNA